MSLSDFVLNHDLFMDKYFYACTRYSVDSVSIQERRHVIVGILFLSLGVLCEIFYMPCVWAVYQQTKMKRCPTCYSFMLYLGVVDTVGLLLTAFVCGIMSIKGIVYCQMPLFTFIYCNVGMFGWFACNTTTLLLAINRCMVLIDDDLADRLFKGQRGTLWLIIPTIVGLLGIWFSPPVVYNPIDSSAILNPHRHYLADEPFV
ncbi:serpentine type 7TM GPCR chemoreceptor srt domain-containing protein [Ditylenchus destructor]|nr:serpentine type 7TM GPCR chemoreceptor srt domain-containing protein [Ditylenchus destructor]